MSSIPIIERRERNVKGARLTGKRRSDKMGAMRRFAEDLFPLFFAAFTGTVFYIAGRFGPGGREPLTGVLVTCAALGWSALTWFRGGERRLWKTILAALALFAPPLLVELGRMGEEARSQYRIIYQLIILGMFLIVVYFRISDRRQREN